MKYKKINLATVMISRAYYNCYGYLIRLSNGRYSWQNDNDLGLDLSMFDCRVSAKRIKCGNGYAYLIKNKKGCVPKADIFHYGYTLKDALLLLRYCHEFYENFTEEELKRIQKFYYIV